MAVYQTDTFLSLASELGISLSDVQIDQFMKYYECLIEYNSFMNLTAITDFDEVILKHFIDSISLCYAMSLSDQADIRNLSSLLSNGSLIDVGTGAGFPGIPLKILYPDCSITLLDSLGKRVKFLNEVIARLELKSIEAIHGRAEDYAKPSLLREKFDFCVSRAVANLSTLSEYCLPFVKKDGYFIPYKSEKGSEELEQANKAIQILGGKLVATSEFLLPQSDLNRILFFIQKEKMTPSKYPRKSGTPSKEPIGFVSR